MASKPVLVRKGESKEALEDLFRAAKAKDEHEFCWALLRFRGLEEAHRDPFMESQQLAQQFLALGHGPVVQDFRIRVLLFVWAHLSEMDGFCSTVANMLRITGGERYSIDPLERVAFRPADAPCWAPVETGKTMKLATEYGFPRIANLLGLAACRQVRNAFFHSDYVLSPTSFNIRHGEPAYVDGAMTRTVPYGWLGPRLELGINFVINLLNVRRAHMARYSSSKVVQGRFGPNGEWTEVEILADSRRRLYGFASPPRTRERRKSAAVRKKI
jgi:hypothetical protein